jgi:hypothetical protein
VAVTRHQVRRALWIAAAFLALALVVTYGAMGHLQIATVRWFAAGLGITLVRWWPLWVWAE